MISPPADANPSNEAEFRVGLEVSLGKLDQSVTAHSKLRDRLSRRATILSSTIIFSAVVVTFLATSSSNIKELLFLSPNRADQITGLAGFIILILSIFELKVRWRERSASHAEAASALSRLKLLIARELGSEAAISKLRYTELHQTYENINDLVTKIPENQFLALKAAHRRKVEISKLLDKHPGTSIRLMRIKIWLRDNIRH